MKQHTSPQIGNYYSFAFILAICARVHALSCTNEKMHGTGMRLHERRRLAPVLYIQTNIGKAGNTPWLRNTVINDVGPSGSSPARRTDDREAGVCTTTGGNGCSMTGFSWEDCERYTN